MFRTWIFLGGLACGPLQAGSGEQQPAYLLELPGSVGTVLVAEAETSTLHVFENDGGQLHQRRSTYMSIGQYGVGKSRPWDRRTPLGAYFVTERLDTAGMHEKYGPVAFPIDYPNAWDRGNGRGGDGIWIHGVTPGDGRRPARDTDGCIALPNDELLALEPQLLPGTTPVVIARRLRWASPDEVAVERRQLRQALAGWVSGMEDGDIHRYLSFYAGDFTYRGMNRDEWAAFRMRSLGEAPPEKVSVDELFVIADPEEAGLYLSRFRQSITVGGRTVMTTKRLYWKRQSDGSLAIVAEDNG